MVANVRPGNVIQLWLTVTLQTHASSVLDKAARCR